MKLKQFIFALVAMLSFSFSAFAQTVTTPEALKAALESTTGSEVVLSGDITLPAQITVPKKTAHTLDLNGHKIAGGIYVYGTLTINDNAGTGSITANTYVLNGAGGSKIILNGGRIYRGSSWSVYTTGVFVVNNGGKVENTIRVAGSGSIQLNGGTVTNVQVTSGNLNVSGSAVVNGNLNIETGAKGVNISAGTINGDITIATEVADKVTVSGGTFKDGEAVSEYMEEGKAVVKNEDGSYSVVDGLLKIKSTGKCYPSLGDAFDAAVAGDVITLLDDVRVDDKYPTNQSKGITLDINGYTLSSYNNIHRVFDNGENGNITITDSKKTGKIVGYSIRNKGQMRVQGVRLEFEDGIDCRGGDLYVDGCTIIGKKFAMQNDGGNTTVSNTTLSAETYAIEHRVYGASKTFTIGEGVVIKSGKVHTYDIDPRQNIVFPEGYFAATIQKYQTSQFTRAYYYCALPAAVEAVKNGGTVQVLSDVELKDILTLDKAVTLDGNGKTLTSAAGRAINVDCADEVNIQNLTIAGATGCERGINIINKAGTTNIDNVKVSGVSHYAVHVATSAGAAKVNIQKSDLTGYAAVAAYGEGGKVSVENSNLVGINNYANNGSNSFSTIAVGSNVNVNVVGGSVKAVSQEGKDGQFVLGAQADVTGASITADAELITEGTAEYFDLDLDNNTVTVREVYSRDYITNPAGNGLVTLTGASTVSINGVKYGTLQAAINAVQNGETITLTADIAENVTIVQAPDVKFTIDGAQKTMNGTITVDGKSNAYATAGVTIKNVKFNATGIAMDACINLSDGTTATRYTNNVTVDNCTFTGGNKVKAAIKAYQGGDKNLTVTGCAVDNTMHSLIQAANIAGVVVDGCTVESKNGINLNSSSNVEIKNSTIEVNGYAVRAGVSGGTSGNIELANNTLKTNGSEDAVIVIRGTASEQINLAMSQNVVSGATHISGTTNKTKVSADANYWDGATAPVTSGTEVAVNSYYKDDALQQLVRIEKGSIYAYVYADRIFGDVTTNAAESLVVEIIGADGNVIGTSTLEKPEHRDGTMKTLTWRINFGADDSGSWAMQWNEGAPSINNIPAKVRVMVDGKPMAEAAIKYTANGDGQSPVVAAKNAADGKFSFVVAEGKFNLDTAAETLNAAIAAGDNVAILAAGTYKVPTGKDLTITGAVEGVEFANIGAHNMGGANVTFNNVTFTYASNSTYKGLQHSGNLVYNNCTFNGQVFLYGQSETFNKCTFNTTDAANYNVWTYGAKEVAFNECTFNSAGKSVLIYAESASVFNDVTVTNSTFNASQAVDGKAAIEMDASLTAGINLTIDDATTATGFAAGNVSGNSLWNNKKGNADDDNNDITVVVAGETVLAPVYEAKIGEQNYRNLQDAINAVKNGETVVIVKDFTGNVTVSQVEGVSFVIDGDSKKFDGTIYVDGNSRQPAAETLTIQNVNFVASAKDRYFVDANDASSENRYSHNVTIKDCNFTATEGSEAYHNAVAARFRQAFDIKIQGGVFTNMHSVLQAYGCTRVEVSGVKTVNSKSGVSFGTSTSAVLKNVEFAGCTGYGVRADAEVNTTLTIENAKIEAFIPVVVRKATQNYNVVITGDETNITATNDDDIWCAVGTSEYETNGTMPTAAAGKVKVSLNNNLDAEGVYGNFVPVAAIGDVEYDNLQKAIDAATEDANTIKLVADLVIDSETYTIADGKNVTLDMNGKKITVTDNKTSNYELFYIYGGMTVTGNGTIELEAINNRGWNASSSIFHNRGGVLTIANGTFKHLGGTDMAYVVDNSGNWYGDATTNINGGELSSTYIAIRNRMEQNSHGASGEAILNVTAGTISGTSRAIWAQAASTSETAPAKGVINISGGTINGLIDTPRSTGAQSMTTVTGGTVAAFKGEVGELKVVTPGTITGEVTILTAAGEVVDYMVNTEGVYVDKGAVIKNGTWGGIDWSLTNDGTLTIAPTAGEPVPDKNAPTKRTYKVGEWRETVIYKSNGSASAIGGAPYDMNAVKKLIIKEGVTKIGSFTCQFPNLTGEVVIPSTVTYIGQEAFHKTPITKLTFAAGGTEPLCIANGVFKKTLIEEVSFPGDRPSIEIHHWAFGGSTKLKTAYIPANLTKVWGGEHVDYFDNFNSQTNVSWTNIGSIFTGCTAMETITFETEEIRDFFFAGGRQNTAEDPMVAAADLVAYNSLDKAIAAATDDIILCKNATLKDTWTIAAGKDMTLNLNGKTLSQSKACTASYAMINNKGNLTITGNGKISFTDTSAGDPNFNWGSYTVRNEGNLVVENGTIEHKGAQAFGTHCIMAIYQYCGSTIIKGGKISTPNYRSVRLWKGDMTINGGTFDGQVWVQAVDESAKLTINGGTFAPSAKGDASSVFVENKTYGVEFAVANGTFNGKIGCSDATKLAGPIEGGNFSEVAKRETNTALLADGFIFNDELVNGYYAVVEGLAGEGTVENPYLISTAKQLEVFRSKVNSGDTKYNAPGVWVALGADIDLAGAEWNVGIGDGHNYSFDGNFDGKNKTIKNLNIKPYTDESGYLCGGLFGYIYGAVTIKDLVIENATVEYTGEGESHNVGVLAGFAYKCNGAVIDNVTVKGNIKVNAPNTYGVGAIVGYTHTNAPVITNCQVLANNDSYIKGHRFVGGITGYSYNGAVIDNCTVENLAITGEIGVGGIAGLALNGNKIAGCTVKYVTVNGDKNVAYIVGELGSGDGGNVTVADNCNAPQPWVGGSYATGESFVATIGTQYYTSVAKAIEAAKENDVITLIADIAATDIITINKPVTLDGNGKTLTSTAGRAINVSGADGVTIKNLTINATGERAINVIQNATNVTIEEVIATAANYTVNVAASAPNAVVAINNSTLNGLCTVNVAAAGANVTVDNSTVNCNDNNTNEGEAYAALCLNKEAVGGSIVATNTTVNVAEGSDSQKGRNGAENGTVTINGSTDGVTVMVAAITYPGSDYYHSFASLAEAVEFAKAGDVVSLIRDITASEIITINKAITLDGNGKTLTSTAARAINIETEGKVVINNLTVNAGERAFNIINKAAKVELNGVTATANNNAVMIATSAGAANVTINGCDFTGLAVVNVAGAGAQVAINGTEITNVDATDAENYGAITVWTTAEEAVVNVDENTTITVADDSKKAYVFPANATVNGVDEVGYIVVTIGDAGYDTLAEAVEKAKAGETIEFVRDITTSDITTINKNVAIDGNGKTLTYTGTDRAFQITGGTVAISNLTIDMPNAAEGNRGINLYNGGTNAALDVTLNKVTINGGKAYAVNIGGGKDNKLTINGSTLTGYAAINVHTSSVNHTIVVDGSTLNGKNHNNNYSFGTVVVDGTNAHSLTITNTTITTENLEGVTSKYDKVVVNANCTLNWDGGEAAVRSILADSKKGKLYYTDLQTAIDDAAEVSGTVQILGNITATKSIAIPAAKKVTIDLNGKTITGTDTGTASYGLININPEAELTINDATGNGAIKLTATENRGWNAYSSVISNQRGKLTVNGGTIEHLGGTDMAYAIDILTNTGAQNAETVINGGTIKSTYRAVRQFLNSAKAENILTVNGGTIEGTNKSIWMQDANANANPGALTVAADAAIKGDVYLTVTAGSTAWPVEVAIAAAALQGESKVLDNGNVPAGYDLALVDGVYGVYSGAAKIGTTYYATLAEAVKAVQEGETITILAGTHSEGTIKLPATLKNVTIEGAEGAVLKDMTISAADGNAYSYVGLTFDGITFDNSRLLFTGWRNGDEVIENLTVTNCTFKNLYDTTNTAPVHINKDASEPVNGFTFTNNVIDGATGGQKSGIYLQATGNVVVENNVINNVSFRPYVIQLTTDDGIADNFIVKGNTFSGSAVGRAQGLGSNDAGTDAVNLVISNNIFEGITDSQQICYWNFNAETTTTDFSKNYYDIENIIEKASRFYFNGAAADASDLIEMGIYPYYAALNEDGTIDESSLVEAPVAVIGTTGYTTLAEAVQAAVTGETVTLTDDVETSAAGYATIGKEKYAVIVAVKEKDITLDLNGKSVTVTPTVEELDNAAGDMLMSVFGMDTNGKLTLTGNGSVKVNANGATIYSLAAAYGEGAQLTINNGSYFVDEMPEATSLIYAQRSESVIINGGTYNIGNVGTLKNGSPWIFNTKGQNVDGIYVYGGTYPTDINHQFWFNEAIVPGHLAVKANEDGTSWSVVEAAAYTREVGRSTGSWRRNVGYATIEEAIAATQTRNCEGNVVALAKNVEIEQMITVANGVEVTLDLNGKTLAATDNTSKNYSAIDNRGDLTIVDSSEGENEPGTGKITVTATVNSGWNRYSAVIANNPGGELTVMSGTIEHLGGTDMAYGIDNLTNGKGTHAVTEIYGGTVKSPYRAVRQFLNGVEANNTLAVYGGTLEGANKSIWMQDPSKNANTGNLYVGEEAVLNGDVYLTVTAGSTAWPVEAYIEKAALAEGKTVLVSNVPADAAALVEYDTFWQVEQKNLAELTIVDEDYTEYINKVEKNVETLTYVREFTGEWETIYLPFGFTITEEMAAEFEFAYIYNASYKGKQATFEFVEVGVGFNLAANYPYLVKAKEAGENEIVVENAKLMPTKVETIDCSSIFEKFSFIGNYATVDADNLDATKGYFSLNGAWSKMETINPFRFYMQIALRNGDAFEYPTDPQAIRMRSVNANGETTGIDGVDAEQAGDFIFDIHGRRVLETEKGGIYIKNGKKFIAQ